MSSAIPCVSCGRASTPSRPWRKAPPECRDCREVRRGRAPHDVRIPERVAQRQIVHLLRSVGAQVWVLGTTRRRGDHPGTMQTPGICDVVAFVPRAGLLMVEVKAKGGRLRPEQSHFRDCCREHHVAHVVGGVDEVIAWLVGQGILRADALPWYRQEGAAAESPILAAQQPRRATQPVRAGQDKGGAAEAPRTRPRTVRQEAG